MAFRETGTKATWANPTVVPVAQRQNGAWYFNPATGSVDRWWSDTAGATSTALAPSGTEPAFDVDKITSDLFARRAAKESAGAEAENAALNEYKTAIAGQEPLETAYNRYGTELGVPGLTSQLTAVRGEVFKVKDLLDRLEEDVGARTTGQLMTEAQRRRLLAAEGTPLETQLGRLTTGMGEVSGQLSTALEQMKLKLSNLSADQLKNLKPYEAKITAVSNRVARELTGFNQDQENVLSTILSKISRGQQLADQEWQQASSLATSERDFTQKKELLRLEYSLKTAEGNPPAALQTEFNTAMGQPTAVSTSGVNQQSLLDKIFGVMTTNPFEGLANLF